MQVALDPDTTLIGGADFLSSNILVTGRRASEANVVELTETDDYTIAFADSTTYKVPTEGSVNIYFTVTYEIRAVEKVDYYVLNVTAPTSEGTESTSAILLK